MRAAKSLTNARTFTKVPVREDCDNKTGPKWSPNRNSFTDPNGDKFAGNKQKGKVNYSSRAGRRKIKKFKTSKPLNKPVY